MTKFIIKTTENNYTVTLEEGKKTPVTALLRLLNTKDFILVDEYKIIPTNLIIEINKYVESSHEVVVEEDTEEHDVVIEE